MLAPATARPEAGGEPAPWQQQGGPRSGRPVLLMFHGGGFIGGSPDQLDVAAAVARDAGFETVQVDYALGDSVQALRDAKRIARHRGRRHRVFAYGESAGGTLACRLAELKLAAAANCMSPVADIVAWGRSVQPDPELRRGLLGTLKQRRYVGLVGHPAKRPVEAEVGEEDFPDIVDGIRRWTEADPRVRLVTVPGGHVGSDSHYEANMTRAVAWLARRATR
jgi:hypothetical protein